MWKTATKYIYKNMVGTKKCYIMEIQEIHTLSTDYGPLWTVLAALSIAVLDIIVFKLVMQSIPAYN